MIIIGKSYLLIESNGKWVSKSPSKYFWLVLDLLDDDYHKHPSKNLTVFIEI